MRGDPRKLLDCLGRNPMSKNSSLTSFSMDDCYWLYSRGIRAGKYATGEVWELLRIWDIAFFHVKEEIGFSWEEYARTNQASGKREQRN
jgi:hypothetical protein